MSVCARWRQARSVAEGRRKGRGRSDGLLRRHGWVALCSAQSRQAAETRMANPGTANKSNSCYSLD